jgi:hypothetical protein
MVPASLSALLLAREYLSRISTTAFTDAVPAGLELPGGDQLTGVIGLDAVCVLATSVTQLVESGAGLRGVWSAREVEAVATGKLTDW